MPRKLHFSGHQIDVLETLDWRPKTNATLFASGAVMLTDQCSLRTLLVLHLIDSLAAAQAARHHCGL
jgi:hypothetical protein